MTGMPASLRRTAQYLTGGQAGGIQQARRGLPIADAAAADQRLASTGRGLRGLTAEWRERETRLGLLSVSRVSCLSRRGGEHGRG